MRHVKKIAPLVLLTLLAVCLAAPAFASKFTNVSATVTDGNVRTGSAPVGGGPIHGGLFVTFREVGVNASQPTTYIVSAECTAVYACLNKNGKPPAADSKRSIVGPVTASVTLTADVSGQVTGSIPVPPIGPGDFTCISGRDPELAIVSYSNVVISDPAHGAQATLPGPFSLTIIPLK